MVVDLAVEAVQGRRMQVPDDAGAIPRLLLTAEEAAEAIAVSRTKMYGLLRVGAVESVRIGGARRIPREALERFVEHLRAEASGY